jgi:outer membrane protein assembly factor BamB
MQNYYLELSEEEAAGGSSHKFYAVVVDGCKVTITYGRIGTDGFASTQELATPEDAEKLALKKVGEKKKKGYEIAEKGVRKKRVVTRRTLESRPSSSKKNAPVLWRFRTGSSAFGVFVDANGCWVGNQNGQVFKLSHEAEVLQQFQLSEGVKSIVSDNSWVYVGCDDGNVYDLSGKTPRLAYEISEDIDILWLDINNGLLAVSDSGGNLTAINYDNEEQWKVKTSGTSAWMVRCDPDGRIFYGDSTGVSCYFGINDGTKIWHKKTSDVLFGWLEGESIYAGTSASKIHQFEKDGKSGIVFEADNAVFSCAASPNGQYVFAGDNSSTIYCFNQAGERLWKLATGCGSAYSMQYFHERLYIVTTDGSFACIDVSEAATQQVKDGVVVPSKTIKAPTEQVAVVQSDVLETAPANTSGVVVKCVKDGSKLKMKVESTGYKNWNVQFPKNLRKEGQLYLVDSIVPAAQGDFYRVLGNIYVLNRG